MGRKILSNFGIIPQLLDSISVFTFMVLNFHELEVGYDYFQIQTVSIFIAMKRYSETYI